MDHDWLTHQISNPPVNKIATPFKVREIGSSKYETDEYIALSLYLLGQTPNGELAYACIWRELHLVDSFAANMLVVIHIIGLESIIINLWEKTIYVSSCAIILKIDTKQRGLFIRRKLLTQYNLIISPHSHAPIPLTSPGLPNNRDLLFELSFS